MTQHRILVVDDDAQIRKAVGRMLMHSGHVVLEAENVPTAVRLIKESKIDLLLLDVIMPGPDGLSMLKELVMKEDGPKCVLMSGKVTNLEKGARMGADWVLSKPFTVQDLEDALAILEDGVDTLY